MKKTKKNQTEVQTTLEALNKGRKGNKVQLKKLEEELEDLKLVPVKNVREIEECENKVEKLSSEKSKLEETLQENLLTLEEKTRPLVIKKDDLVSELEGLQNTFDEAKAELTVVESELKILKSDETNEKRKFENFRIAFEESNNDLNTKLEALEEIKEAFPQIRQEIEKKTVDLQQNKSQQKIIYNKLMGLKTDVSFYFSLEICKQCILID